MHGALIVLVAAASFLAEGARARDNAPQLVARQDTGTGTGTSTGATVSATPILAFEPVVELTTCTSATIQWAYVGPSTDLTLTITNLGVPQVGAPSSTNTLTNTFTDIARRAVPTGANGVSITSTIGTVDPSSDTFNWPVVTVPEGWYVIYASVTSPPYVHRSDQFYVSAGVDTSCVVTASSTSITASSTSPISTAGTTTSPPDNTGSGAPIGASSSSSNKTGIIAGVVVTVAVLIIAAIIAYFLMRRRWRTRTGAAGAFDGGAGGGSRGWGGLTSVDSTRGFSRHRSKTGSANPIVGPGAASTEGVSEKISSASTPGHGHSTPVISPFDDPADGDLGLAAPGLVRSGSTGRQAAGRRYSYTSSAGYSMNEYGLPMNDGRRPSVPESVGARRPSVESTTYPPSSPTHYAAHDMARSASSSSNITPTSNLHRGAGSVRKTARKPVPVYDASTTSLPSADVPSPVSPFDSPPDSALGHDAAVAAIYSNGMHGHYATRTNSQPAVNRESEHELVHKSSFGPGGVEGKQLHYLIPDMPLGGEHA